jgi:hypothetical protein
MKKCRRKESFKNRKRQKFTGQQQVYKILAIKATLLLMAYTININFSAIGKKQ